MKRYVSLLCLIASILAAPPSAGQSANPRSTVADDYTIGREDVLDLQVLGRPDLSNTVFVDPAGRAQMPLLGEVDVEGATPSELGLRLTREYRLLDPSISDVMVSVAEYNSRRIFVVGEVRTPGPIGFRDIPDIWTVLLTAGGATPVADLSRVQVVRRKQEDGSARMLTIDLSKGIESTPAEGLPSLRPRDTIVVPSLAEQAAGGDRIHVFGAVAVPGVHRTGSARTVIEALSVSGGPLPDADLGHVVLTRSVGPETVTYRLDVSGHLRDARPDTDIELQPGDVITVPRRRGFFGFIRDVAPMVSLFSAAAGLVIAFN